MNDLKYFTYILMIIVNLILQTTFFEAVAIMGIKPNTTVILVVSIAFLQGEKDGIITGLIAGFLQDSFFAPALGCNMFIYALLGLICGYFFKAFYKESFLMPIVLCAAADLFYSILFYLINMLLKGYPNLFGFFLPVILPELVYTVLVSAFLYRIIYVLTELLNNKNSYKRRLF